MSNNPRITKKELGLIKGAIRRVFSRSELRRRVIDATVMEGYTDPTRPRVKKWCRCAECKQPTPKSYLECDHIAPIILLDSSLESMVQSNAGWDNLIDRVWCEIKNLQGICQTCHERKSLAEGKLRRQYKKEKKNG